MLTTDDIYNEYNNENISAYVGMINNNVNDKMN